MKIKILSLAILSSMSIATAQQTTSQYQFDPELYKVGMLYNGYIISLQGDTTYGYIKAGNRCNIGGIGKSNQNYVEFYNNETDTKPSATYKPSQIRGYKVSTLEYESITYSGGMTREINFNLITGKGAIRTYVWYATVENFQNYGRFQNETWEQFDARRFESKVVFCKDRKDAYDMSMLALGFIKKIVPMIEDYKELAEKVTKKEKGYNLFKILDIIEEYNEWKKLN